MIITELTQRAAAFCDRNGFTFDGNKPAWLIGKMVCHDALHDILGLDLTGGEDEYEDDDIEGDVLIVQNLIKAGHSAEYIISDVKDFIPGVKALNDKHVETMHYFFNLKGE